MSKLITQEITRLHNVSAITNKHRERIKGVLMDAGLSGADIYAVQCHISSLRMEITEALLDEGGE